MKYSSTNRTLTVALTSAFAVLTVVMAIMLLSGCSRRAQSVPAASAAQAQTAVARPGSVPQTRRLGGFVAPSANVSISSSLGEPAVAVYVVEGQRVSAGETLAVLDTTDLRAEYDSDVHAAGEADANARKQYYSGAQTIGAGESNVANAKATLLQAQERERLDNVNLTRDADLLRQQFIARQTYDAQLATVQEDEAATRSDVATLASAQTTAAANGTQSNGLQGASLQAAREAAEQARAIARQVAASIVRATIVAPVSGVVTNRNLNPGEYPGSRTLFTIQAIDTVFAQLNASSEQLAGVAAGERVAVAAESGHDTAVGRVVALLGQAAPGSTNFTVKVRIDNRGDAFLAGTAVVGTIELPAIRGIVVPRAALDADETQVGVVRGGTYHTAPIRVVAEDGDRAVVTGIGAGTRVVTDAPDLHDGEKVAVR